MVQILGIAGGLVFLRGLMPSANGENDVGMRAGDVRPYQFAFIIGNGDGVIVVEGPIPILSLG